MERRIFLRNLGFLILIPSLLIKENKREFWKVTKIKLNKDGSRVERFKKIDITELKPWDFFAIKDNGQWLYHKEGIFRRCISRAYKKNGIFRIDCDDVIQMGSYES